MRALLAFLISLNAFANLNPTVTLKVDVEKRQPTDILFVVDNSGSMQDHQSSFKNMAKDLIDGLKTVDYKISAISTDIDDRFTNFVIESDGANNAVEFEKLIMSFGTNGSADEYVFKRVFDFVGRENFLRNQANLDIIAITDEKEQSSDFNVSTSELVEKLSKLNKKFRVHTFTEFNEYCGDYNPDSTKFEEIASLTGGFVMELCGENLLDNYKKLIKSIVDRVGQDGLFVWPTVYRVKLHDNVDIDSIKVYYGSQVIQRGYVGSGWGYDQVNNELVLAKGLRLDFENDLEKITIEYRL